MSFDDDDTFRRVTLGGLYCTDTSNMDESYFAMHNHSTTLKMKKIKYKKREVRRADEAMKFQHRLSQRCTLSTYLPVGKT